MDGWSRRSVVGLLAAAPAFTLLSQPFLVERIPGGSHLFHVKAAGIDLAQLRACLTADRIHAPEPIVQGNEPALLVGVNES